MILADLGKEEKNKPNHNSFGYINSSLINVDVENGKRTFIWKMKGNSAIKLMLFALSKYTLSHMYTDTTLRRQMYASNQAAAA